MDTIPLKELLEKIIELNDKRYSEVNIEKEKALKIKEEADKVALGLARDIQKYKDEKANELREQISSERGLYVTNEKFDAAMKPVSDFISQNQGKSLGYAQFIGWIVALVTVLGFVITNAIRINQ